MKRFMEEHGEGFFYMVLGLTLTGWFGAFIYAVTMY